MRAHVSSLVAIGSLISAVVIVACSSDVTTDEPTGTGTTSGAGGSGTTGSGGAPVTSSSSTTSNSSSTSTTSSTTSSTGGGTKCDDACGHAADCGLDVCAFAGIDCATAGNQYDCFSDCVIVAPCDEINALANQNFNTPLGACLQGCQGGGGGAGGGGVGGGPAGTCQQCGQNNCQNAAFQCFQQSGQQECQNWITCVGGCADSACFDNCTAMYPGGQVIADCACTSCAADCGALCAGGGGGGGGAP